VTPLLIALGGGVGALLRWGIASILPKSNGGFPVGITVVNVIGSFFVGVVVGLVVSDVVHVATAPITVGLLGGFTTFSTWMVDIEEAPTKRMNAAVAVIPLVLGLAAAAIGIAIGVAR
jgi:CrcB protein